MKKITNASVTFISRRHALKALTTLCALAWSPAWAQGSVKNPRRLIVVMLRGAVDGLSVVIPYTDENYYRARRTIAIAKPGSEGGAIALNDEFALHPALAMLKPFWDNGTLAFVHACGSPDNSRSHFDAQDYMETATPGSLKTNDGWLNRLIGSATFITEKSKLVSVGPSVPRIVSGQEKFMAIPAADLISKPTILEQDRLGSAVAQLYGDDLKLGDTLKQAAATRKEVRASLDRVANEKSMGSDSMGATGDAIKVAAQADRGAGSAQVFIRDARNLGLAFRSDPKLQLGFLAVGGWDTHIAQGAAQGQLSTKLAALGEGLVELAQSLGDQWANTSILVLSEFGRTVRENGTGGTDHGRGNVAWLLGGTVKGGHVYGRWPGLEQAQLADGRDLQITTDFRAVISAVLTDHLKVNPSVLATVLPNYAGQGIGSASSNSATLGLFRQA